MTTAEERIEGRPVSLSDIALPPPRVSFSQDEEWCVVRRAGSWEQVRFHDYERIYEIPGLYECLFQKVLECNSPNFISRMLRRQLLESETEPGDLRVLDLGAGNGMVGEELAGLGVRHMVGVDIIDAAAEAARRDRGGLYEDYLVADLGALSPLERERLRARRFNCLTCVAALGFGDIPTEAFLNAFNLISVGGWIAFNIKLEFLGSRDLTGFCRLVHELIDSGTLEVREQIRYQHRLATSGHPLHYVAIVGSKQEDADPELAASSSRPHAES
jgi:2-polyprenyl-3-methyl-5-hydroxy-6-metoxy-1,4-benzoquinol methylase